MNEKYKYLELLVITQEHYIKSLERENKYLREDNESLRKDIEYFGLQCEELRYDIPY